MKTRSISPRKPKGDAIVWIIVILLIAGIAWGVFLVKQNKEERASRLAKIELAEKKKAEQEKIRQANLKNSQETEKRLKKEEAEKRLKDQQKQTDLEKQQRAKASEEERLQAEKESAARKKRQEVEDARRKAEEEAAREAEAEGKDDTAATPEPDYAPFPLPAKNPMPDLKLFYPESKDEIPMNEDKVIGKWSWEAAPKYEDIKDFPTETVKWTDRTKAADLASKYEKWRTEDARRIKAMPSAKDFPGLPEEGAELVARSVKIDSSIGGWHSTGLYAPPGAQITFSFGGGAPKGQISVRIGCHTDNLMNDKTTEWGRPPVIGNSTGMDKARVVLADPCGGLVYVCVDGAKKTGRTFKVNISGATPAPLYIMGETTPEQWKEQLEKSKAPWGEIRMPRLVFTMPTGRLKECVKVKDVAELLQKCMALQDWVAGWDMYPDRIRTPMRFVVDRQISVGYGHSGYPAMGYMDWANDVASGSILTNGSWGLWHELGHNHQGNPFAMEGQTEVSVNIFSLVCETMGVGKKWNEGWGMAPSVMAPAMGAFLKDKSKTYQEGENKIQLFLWAEIMYHFGIESFREVSLAYNKRPYKVEKMTDADKWNWVMKTFGNVTKKNLALFFETWKLPITPSTKAQLKKWPDWQPVKNYPACYIDVAAEKEAETASND